MSTYSVTFAVANYAFIEKTVDGIKFRMYATTSLLKQSEIIIHESAKFWKAFSSYFEVDSTLVKLDFLLLQNYELRGY